MYAGNGIVSLRFGMHCGCEKKDPFLDVTKQP